MGNSHWPWEGEGVWGWMVVMAAQVSVYSMPLNQILENDWQSKLRTVCVLPQFKTENNEGRT